MKKLVLLITLFFSTSLLFAQQFIQPTEFNNVCDNNSDGFESFFLQEISFEILANLNSQDYSVSHHETQMDADIGANPLSSPYFNLNPSQQTIFARIVTIATGEFEILVYSLNVNPLPLTPVQTMQLCGNSNGPFSCWNLSAIVPSIIQGQVAISQVVFFSTEFDAFTNTNPISSPDCYLNPVATSMQPPVFYRIQNLSGCFSVGIVELIIVDCSTPCEPPTNLIVSNSTPTSVVLSWTSNSNETSWQIGVQANGGPTETIYVQQNPFVLTGLACNTNYFFTVVANCTNNQTSGTSEILGFLTNNCVPNSGQPISLTQCVDNGQACFDLTQNDTNILGTLNPSEYTISYYTTLVNANTGVSPIVNTTNYCSTNEQIIYARLENNSSQEFETYTFSLFVDSVSPGIEQLANLSQCDDNIDSNVIFDLTTIQAQLNSTNAFEYYTSIQNAQNQVGAITNATAYSVNTLTPTTTIFVREIIANSCDNLYSFQVFAYANCNLAYTCSEANSLCNSLNIPFANTVGITSGGGAGCLFTTPNPTWFYLPISNEGAINLQISQNAITSQPQDIDYIIYGPFSDPVSACSNPSELSNNIVSCSYSAQAVENAVIPNAIPGQYYLLMVTNFSNQAGLITISQTNLGSQTGAIDCSGLRLNAFLDINSNGSQEVGEQNFPLGQFSFEVNNNGNVHTIVSPTGVYNIYDDNATNSYDLNYTIDPSYVASYGITTSSYSNINVVVGAGMITYNFPITVVQTYTDLAVGIVPINAPRPGFIYQNKIVYSNLGNQAVASGTVTFNNDSLVTITGNTQSGTSTIAGGFSYNFTNLLPFETREMIVSMQVPNIPTVSLGNYLTNTASIAPLAGDVVPANNDASLSQIIIGSYDPNDKIESHGERILWSSFTANDYLYYTIRFENTGTASAINVRVNDVLDSQLDVNSIRMISSSDTYIMDRVGNNITWLFDNIQLPASIPDTAIGKGYITFKVKPLPGYSVGDIISNTASIYFDFNPPIITNTFNTEFVAQLAVSEFENSDFVFYPNPVTDVVTVSLKNDTNEIASVAVYDILGKLIFTQKSLNAITTQTIDLSAVSKGLYLIEVTTTANLKVVKKLIVE